MSTRRASSRGASTITSSSSSSSSTSTSSSTRASRRESRHDTALESAGDEDKHESTSSTSSMQVDSEEPLTEEGDDEYVEQDPTRLTRLDEKSELQGLNKRLEFYILKQRERDASADAWGRELANLKNKHAADLEHQKNLFENQLSIVRKNRDELSAKLSKLEGESAHKDNLLSELQARLSSESKARSSLESRVESLSKELMLSQTSVHTLQNQLDNLRHEFAALQSTNKDLEKALDDSRLAHEQAQSKANKMSQLYSDLKDEYDTLQSRHAADAKKYDKQIHDLCIENNKSVESIRIECENRLNALFSERQYQYDKDKTDSLAELKSSYDAKLFGYRTRLEELGHELEGEKSAHRTAVRNLEKEMKYSESLRSEIAILQQRVSSLEKALAAEKSNPDLMKQLHEKNETIKRVKAAFKRKDAEFDELMDVKIMLDMEIKAYRSLLDQEDHRLNTLQEKETAFSVSTTTTSYSSSSSSVRKSSKRTKSSSDDSTTDVDMTGDATEEGDANDDEQASKKRRRNSTGEAITATPTKKKGKQTEGKSKNSAVLFSRNDSTGEYVAMTNNSGQSASLKGWMLRAPRHDVTFTFPDVQLESGGTFYVVSGVEPKDTGSDDQIAHWPSKVEWDTNSEDIAELVAPSGAVVVTVVVAAKGAAETKKQKDQCTIM